MQPIPKVLMPGEPVPEGYEIFEVKADGRKIVIAEGFAHGSPLESADTTGDE